MTQRIARGLVHPQKASTNDPEAPPALLAGFRPVGRFLSAKYHAGTADSGEDLRPGASATWTKQV